MIITGILSIVLYLTSGILLLLKLNSHSSIASLPRLQLLIPAVIAMLLHGWLVYQGLLTPQGLDVGFFAVLSLVGWLVALLLLSAAFTQPIESLVIFVFPAAALMLGLRLLNPDGYYLSQNLGSGLEFHILMSILAYSLLSIAAVQANERQAVVSRSRLPSGGDGLLIKLERLVGHPDVSVDNGHLLHYLGIFRALA